MFGQEKEPLHKCIDSFPKNCNHAHLTLFPLTGVLRIQQLREVFWRGIGCLDGIIGVKTRR